MRVFSVRAVASPSTGISLLWGLLFLVGFPPTPFGCLLAREGPTVRKGGRLSFQERPFGVALGGSSRLGHQRRTSRTKWLGRIPSWDLVRQPKVLLPEPRIFASQ